MLYSVWTERQLTLDEWMDWAEMGIKALAKIPILDAMVLTLAIRSGWAWYNNLPAVSRARLQVLVS